MMKKRNAGINIVLAGLLIVFLGVTTTLGLGTGHAGSARNIKLGLDLAGGVSITYQVKDEEFSAEDMSDTINKLEKRIQQYSNEASVYQEGDDRINVEIPGVSDANEILEDLGTPGELYFISQYDSEGNENYTTNSDGDYVLAEGKTIESLEEDGSVVLTGTDISVATAESITDQTTSQSEYAVTLEFTEEGTEKFAVATTAAEENSESIGIYYDGEFISVPTVNAAITDGKAQITGGALEDDFSEAESLASYIRIGGLNLQLEEIRSNIVGAQLGEKAISSSLKAGVIGLLIVILFMCFIYRMGGLATSMGLLIYTGIVLVIIDAYQVTLTLPGIAGVILGIGMAVDANVIIFARVKEELALGRSVKTSLRSGFEKAFSAIIDGNITTLIAAAVLWLRGSGTVRGFAQTLAISIVVSMFTALVITRLIVYSFCALGADQPRLYGVKKEKKGMDLLSGKKIWLAIPMVIFMAGIVVSCVYAGKGDSPLNYSLEFEGGTSSTVAFQEDYTLEEIDANIIPEVEKITGDANVQVQKVEDSTDVIIKTRTLTLEERTAMEEMLAEQFGFREDEETPMTSENISSTVSSEMRSNAITAVIIAIICMLLYIFIRFKDFRFAASSILALVHDIAIVLVFYVISRTSVGNTFIACMLTILGYSINATIVIFDRIREESQKQQKNETLADVVNRSISLTLTRSIYTSFTTFVTILLLFILGQSSMREFAMPLMVGILAGTFSSIFLSGSIWYIMKTKIGKKNIVK